MKIGITSLDLSYNGYNKMMKYIIEKLQEGSFYFHKDYDISNEEATHLLELSILGLNETTLVCVQKEPNFFEGEVEIYSNNKLVFAVNKLLNDKSFVFTNPLNFTEWKGKTKNDLEPYILRKFREINCICKTFDYYKLNIVVDKEALEEILDKICELY